MTLDMNGNVVLSWYVKLGLKIGIIIALISFPVMISYFLPIENVQQPTMPIAVTPLSDVIDILMIDLSIIVVITIITFILTFLIIAMEKWGLPREDEIH